MAQENYEERKEARIERYKELAIKNKEASLNAYNYSNKLASMIPMGQPILVGHHSEKSHRSHLKRIHSQMDKFCELQNKSDYYNDKAIAAENNNIISSDDPKAITLLKEKLEKLEKQRTQIKEHNKKAKKENKDILPSWHLSNLGQRIVSIKKRINQLNKLNKLETRETKFDNGIIKENVEENRLQILYDEIPSVEERTKLKRNGFRWSPYNKAWQRQLNNASAWAVENVLNIRLKPQEV